MNLYFIFINQTTFIYNIIFYFKNVKNLNVKNDQIKS